MAIEQAIYGGQDRGGYRFLARSSGFDEGWLARAEQLCTGFGNRPAVVACPLAVFARPFGSRHVAVVQAADQGRDDAGRPGALAFRLLIVPRRLYAELGGDPFRIAGAFPPPWDARGELPALEWTAGPPALRTVEQLRRVIDVDSQRTALLLGGVQILLDGGRLVIERSGPDPELLNDFWALLPTSTRAELWPATFAFGNAHRFHVLVVPDASSPEYENYVPDNRAGDYPEGRYEFALQYAVEHGDQAELDGLLARRSRSQMVRLAVMLLLAFLIIPPLVLHGPFGRREQPPAGGKKEKPGREREAPLKLPPAEEFAALSDPERRQLADHLTELGRRLEVKLPVGTSDAALGEAVAELDRRVDEKLGARKPGRDPGASEDLGPPTRRLRALLWKHGDPEYAETRLNPAELVERLEKALARAGLLTEESGD